MKKLAARHPAGSEDSRGAQPPRCLRLPSAEATSFPSPVQEPQAGVRVPLSRRGSRPRGRSGHSIRPQRYRATRDQHALLGQGMRLGDHDNPAVPSAQSAISKSNHLRLTADSNNRSPSPNRTVGHQIPSEWRVAARKGAFPAGADLGIPKRPISRSVIRRRRRLGSLAGCWTRTGAQIAVHSVHQRIQRSISRARLDPSESPALQVLCDKVDRVFCWTAMTACAKLY